MGYELASENGQHVNISGDAGYHELLAHGRRLYMLGKNSRLPVTTPVASAPPLLNQEGSFACGYPLLAHSDEAIRARKSWPERYNVPWARHDGYAPEAALKSMSRIKEILEEGDRLAIAFWMHDGIFHALLTDQRVCAKLREACQKNEMVSFTFDAKLRILSVL